MPLLRICIALALCSAMALLAALLIRQRGGMINLRGVFAKLSRPTQQIQVVEVRRVSMHGDVALIEHGDRRYLVLLQAGSTTILNEEAIKLKEAAPCTSSD